MIIVKWNATYLKVKADNIQESKSEKGENLRVYNAELFCFKYMINRRKWLSENCDDVIPFCLLLNMLNSKKWNYWIVSSVNPPLEMQTSIY